MPYEGGRVAAAAQYPIRAVARMTGISVDTLRAWERRYEAVVPDRGERGRVYTDRHVDRLKHLAALVEGGHAIGSIASLSDAQLKKLRARDDDSAPRPSAAAIDLEPLVQAMRRYELETIDARLTQFAVLLSPSEFVFSVVLPILREVGTRWETGTITPAQEHLISAIIRGVLGGILRTVPKRAGAARMIFATLSGEVHELGLLCGAVLAAAAGYSVFYLGPNLPANEIARAARTAGAKTIVLSTTTPGLDHRDVRSLTRVAEELDVWVGGAQAAALRSAIGPGARQVTSLEDLRGLLDRHAA